LSLYFIHLFLSQCLGLCNNKNESLRPVTRLISGPDKDLVICLTEMDEWMDVKRVFWAVSSTKIDLFSRFV
jgi:hypothetical protein